MSNKKTSCLKKFGRAFDSFSIYCNNPISKSAAEILISRLRERCNLPICITAELSSANLALLTDERLERDEYQIKELPQRLELYAAGIRGLIFACGYFLRKTIVENGEIILIKSIEGQYLPQKKIRGHQLGYRPTPNAYDAWDYEQYRRYYIDLMFFGCNTCEHIPSEGQDERNSLMKYDPDEFAENTARHADALDMDLSFWYPNSIDNFDEALAARKAFFERIVRIDAVFSPGGDPGRYRADEFLNRVVKISRLLKSIHPEAKMWPSAQAPHEFSTWGEVFLTEISKLPDEIDGVIAGPNHALPLDELRRRLPNKYPIRFYPDITHNVRCEYPVHFDSDDWHYSIAVGIGREGVNPRPTEFRRLHRLTRPYVIGSVSYSEGINDDVNKMLWSDMDFFGEVPLRESLEDYCRLFFYGADEKALTDAILGLEQNWIGDSVENPSIELTLSRLEAEADRLPSLMKNWRFVILLFRACCDALLRRRRCFELELIEKAHILLKKGRLELAELALNEDFPADYLKLREKIEALAALLFEQIGYQLDVKRYGALSWERGATLESIDLPVSDRAWLKNRFEMAKGSHEPLDFMLSIFNRNKVNSDEYYYSVAENGLAETGIKQQENEVYINFLGDRPDKNNGTIPNCMLKIYDNFSFECKLGGFAKDSNYRLIISFLNRRCEEVKDFCIELNSHIIYKGKQFGGKANPDYDKKYLSEDFVSIEYELPKEYFENGTARLRFSEPIMGVMFSEFKIIKA